MVSFRISIPAEAGIPLLLPDLSFPRKWEPPKFHKLQFYSKEPMRTLNLMTLGARAPHVPEYFTSTRERRALATEQPGKSTAAPVK